MGDSIFPDLIEEGKKYGLSESELYKLRRYLNDKRMLKMISLGKFNQDARAWLSALTGIVADVLAIDAHVTMWVDKKLEKPRNWIVSKLTSIIPTKIDDAAFKAIQVAQDILDNKILPLKEDILSNISSKMHDKYEYHNNYTALGMSPKDLKINAKTNLRESKAEAKSVIKELKRRQAQTALHGGYFDKDHNFIRVQSRWAKKNQLSPEYWKRLKDERVRKERYEKQQDTQEIYKERENVNQDELP